MAQDFPADKLQIWDWNPGLWGGLHSFAHEEASLIQSSCDIPAPSGLDLLERVPIPMEAF